MLSNARVPILGFAAPSGTGKTTLLTRLLPILRSLGLRVGVIKHAHHEFDIDQPGKDSYELRRAGAGQMLIASSRRWALMVEKEKQADPGLDELLVHMDQGCLDLILVEGFKHVAFPRIELYRQTLGQPPLYRDDPNIVAIVTDAPLPEGSAVPVLDINQPDQIAQFVCDQALRSRTCPCCRQP